MGNPLGHVWVDDGVPMPERVFKLRKDTTANDKVYFSSIYDGNKSIRSIKRATGSDTPTAKKHIARLIEQGYINAQLEVLILPETLCKKWGYVHVQPPEHRNLTNWIYAAIPAIIKSMRKAKIAAGISHACKWLGIKEKRRIKRWEDRRVNLWHGKAHPEYEQSPHGLVFPPFFLLLPSSVAFRASPDSNLLNRYRSPQLACDSSAPVY